MLKSKKDVGIQIYCLQFTAILDSNPLYIREIRIQEMQVSSFLEWNASQFFTASKAPPLAILGVYSGC